jgi:hypothetical protein
MNMERGEPDDVGGLCEQFLAEARQQLDAGARMIRHCLGQLDDGQVWWRPRPDMNSIGNLLLHLAGNLTQRLGSVIGGEPDVRDRPREFTEPGPIPKVELLHRFDEAVRSADEILAVLGPGRLGETCRHEMLSGPTEKPLLGVVLQTLTHLNGHAQEILHMTRVQLGEGYVFRQPAGIPPQVRGAS